MRLIAYYPEDPIRELGNICVKMLQSGEKCGIFVTGAAAAEEVTNGLWNLHQFLPNQIETEEFGMISPVCIFIGTKSDYSKRSVLICLDKSLTPDTKHCSTFISWNYSLPGSEIYKQENKVWKKIF